MTAGAEARAAVAEEWRLIEARAVKLAADINDLDSIAAQYGLPLTNMVNVWAAVDLIREEKARALRTAAPAVPA